MNFGSLIGLANRNKTDSSSVSTKCFSTAVSPALKPVRSSGPSPNVRAFLAKQDKEKREKDLAAKKEKEHLLSLRAQNSKNNKKAKIMASRTKDNDFSKIRLMTDDELEAKKKREAELHRKMLTDKVERMKARIQLEERDAELPHKRKRKKRMSEGPQEDAPLEEEPIHHVVREQYSNDEAWKSAKPRDSGPPVKKKKLPPTQHFSFQELLKVAAEKQNQLDSGESESEDEVEEDPNRRPMTKKDLEHYREQEMRRKGLSVNNLPKIKKKASVANKNPVPDRQPERRNAPPSSEHPRLNGNVRSVRPAENHRSGQNTPQDRLSNERIRNGPREHQQTMSKGGRTDNSRPAENHRSGQSAPQDRNERIRSLPREQQQTMSKGARTENSRPHSRANSVNGRYSEPQFRGEEQRTSHSLVSRDGERREVARKVPLNKRPENTPKYSQSLPEKSRKVSQGQPVQNPPKNNRRFPKQEDQSREREFRDYSMEEQQYSEEFEDQRSTSEISRHPSAKSRPSQQETSRREQSMNRPPPRDSGGKEQILRGQDPKGYPVKQEKSFLKGEKRKVLTEDPFKQRTAVNPKQTGYSENAKNNSRKPAHPSRVPPKLAVRNPNQTVPPQSAKNPFQKPNNFQSKAPVPQSAYQDVPTKGQQRPSSLPRSAYQDSSVRGQQRPPTVPRSAHRDPPMKGQQRPSNPPRSTHQDSPVRGQQRLPTVPRSAQQDPPMRAQQRPSNLPRSAPQESLVKGQPRPSPYQDSPVKGQQRPSRPKQSMPEPRREPPRNFKEPPPPEDRPRPKLPPIGHIRHKILGPRNPYGKLPSKISKQYYESEDEEEDDDDDMKDFIDDGTNEDCNEDYSKYIRDIFGYDRRRYAAFDDDDDDIMESSFAEQMKEEQRSARIGLLEDLEDIRKEEEEKKMKTKKKKK